MVRREALAETSASTVPMINDPHRFAKAVEEIREQEEEEKDNQQGEEKQDQEEDAEETRRGANGDSAGALLQSGGHEGERDNVQQQRHVQRHDSDKLEAKAGEVPAKKAEKAEEADKEKAEDADKKEEEEADEQKAIDVAVEAADAEEAKEGEQKLGADLTKEEAANTGAKSKMSAVHMAVVGLFGVAAVGGLIAAVAYFKRKPEPEPEEAPKVPEAEVAVGEEFAEEPPEEATEEQLEEEAVEAQEQKENFS